MLGLGQSSFFSRESQTRDVGHSQSYGDNIKWRIWYFEERRLKTRTIAMLNMDTVCYHREKP
jgi:hypothetical protein